MASAPLASGPDYVRFVEATGEVWVTEPDEDRLEVFNLPASGIPKPSHAAFLKIDGGPESLHVAVLVARDRPDVMRGDDPPEAVTDRLAGEGLIRVPASGLFHYVVVVR